MGRIRLLCMVVAVVGVAGALAAANAWARANPVFLFSGSGLPPITVSIKTPSGAAHTLFYYHASSQPLVECELARGTGEILNVSGTAWLKGGAITYEECKVTNYETTCAINGSMLHGSLKLSGLEGEVGYYEPPSPEVLFHMKSASGTFAEMEFTGTRCPLAGVNNLKKGVIGEIPGPYVDTTESKFKVIFGVNGSLEQRYKEIEDSLTTTVDELKLGTTRAAIKGELEFTLPSGEMVSIFT